MQNWKFYATYEYDIGKNLSMVTDARSDEMARWMTPLGRNWFGDTDNQFRRVTNSKLIDHSLKLMHFGYWRRW